MATFTGTPGDDIFTGGVESDVATGGAGRDRLTGSDGSDTLVGGLGADTLEGGAGDDLLYGGDAQGPYQYYFPGASYIVARLDNGTDVDNLIGGDGTDYIFAGYGDSVDGGPGGSYGDYIYISFAGAPSGVTADFGLVTQTIGGGVITSVENVSYVQGSAFGDNINARSTGTGYSAFNTVNGGDGNDTLTAGYYSALLSGDNGDDVVDGRPSQYLSSVDGGAGNDTLYTNTNTSAQANGGAGDDTIYAHGQTHGGAGNDTIAMQTTYYAGLVYGDEGDDRITTTEAGNYVAGGSGADTLNGASGADRLFSAGYAADFEAADDMGLERDRVIGGGGDDTLAIGYGDDVDGGSGSDSLRLSLGGVAAGANLDLSGIVAGSPFSLGGGVIQGVERLLYLRGSDAADRLTLPGQGVMLTVNAGGGDDTITASSSSVSVLGGDGSDRFVSGAAADTFDGGAGVDTIDYGAFGSAVTVNLRTGAAPGGDSLVRVEGVVGTGFDDTLVGAGAGSILTGGAGADRLELGARDTAVSGPGADLIVVAAGSHSAASAQSVATVTDWGAGDRLQFGAATGAYTEITAESYPVAVLLAELQAAAGYNFVSVQVGADVYVFGQPIGGRLHFDEAVRLVGVTLDAVSAANVGLPGPLEPPLPLPPPPASAPPEPILSAPPSAGFGGASGSITGDMDRAHIAYALDAVISSATSSGFSARVGDVSLQVTGFGFTTDNAGLLVGGTATQLNYSYGVQHGGPFAISMAIPQTQLTTMASWLAQDATQAMFGSILAGADRVVGGSGADLLRSFGGADLISGGGGGDTIWGGTGNDVIYAQAAPGGSAGFAGATYLRGEDGDDYIIGGGAFDDINGNPGADTASGGLGDDWVVGGKDADLLFGDAGGDLVYGNIGADTCVGGAGNDTIRGGQDNDLVFGGAGADFVSGDRGDDTMIGGEGADLFHTFGDAGGDLVLDFNAAEGDRVMLDPGTSYAAAQIGADTVITMVGGGRMLLAGVTLSSLPAGWIFGP